MPSSLGWVVLDEQNKRAVQEATSLLRGKDTVDELGLGVVRDTLSDLLFPGTSVLQTRAKYLLFVPWIYDGLRREGRSGRNAVELGRKREKALIGALLEGDPDAPGIIGKRARDDLKRLPSAVYWAALQRYGILTWTTSVDGYCQALRSSSTPQVRLGRDEDGNPTDLSGPWRNLPDPEDYSSVATLDLSLDQAGYLYDRIAATNPETMLLWLLDRGPGLVSAPWEHPDVVALPGPIRTILDHARWFSLVTHGAVIQYNVLLAEKSDLGDLTENFRWQFSEWRLEYDTQYSDGWDTGAFWRTIQRHNPRLNWRTKEFLDGWFILAGAIDDCDDPRARDLVQKREVQLKINLARLTNPSALENWQGSSGMDRLTYRWRSVADLTQDIHQARRVRADA